MFSYLDFHSYFEASNPHHLHILCKVLLLSKFMAKIISWSLNRSQRIIVPALSCHCFVARQLQTPTKPIDYVKWCPHVWLSDPYKIHVQGKFQQIYKPCFKRNLFTHYARPNRKQASWSRCSDFPWAESKQMSVQQCCCKVWITFLCSSKCYYDINLEVLFFFGYGKQMYL